MTCGRGSQDVIYCMSVKGGLEKVNEAVGLPIASRHACLGPMMFLHLSFQRSESKSIYSNEYR